MNRPLCKPIKLKVMVDLTAIPSALPVLACRPEGMSRDNMGMCLAALLIAVITALYSPVHSRSKPVPSKASTMISVEGSLLLKR